MVFGQDVREKLKVGYAGSNPLYFTMIKKKEL